jgi:hypothetical protein
MVSASIYAEALMLKNEKIRYTVAAQIKNTTFVSSKFLQSKSTNVETVGNGILFGPNIFCLLKMSFGSPTIP